MMIYQTRTIILLLSAGCLIISGCRAFSKSSDARPPMVVAVFEDFNLSELSEAWTFRTPELWEIAAEGDRRFLQMLPPPDRPMLPGVPRPQEYALYMPYQFRSFNLSCRVRIDREVTVKGRDACLFWGWRDDTHSYYVHLSDFSDEMHNAVVRVAGQTRKSLIPSQQRPVPAITDGNWHKVDIVRDCDAGTIKIYVDLYEENPNQPPLFEVTDRTYEWGYIGLGSFNDHASFARLRIEGQARKAPATSTADVVPPE